MDGTCLLVSSYSNSFILFTFNHLKYWGFCVHKSGPKCQFQFQVKGMVCHKIWRAKSIPLQPLALGCWIMLGIKQNDHVSNSLILTMTNTKPLHCVRKHQLGFLGIFFGSQRKNLPEGMLSTYHHMAKGDLDDVQEHPTLPIFSVC